MLQVSKNIQTWLIAAATPALSLDDAVHTLISSDHVRHTPTSSPCKPQDCVKNILWQKSDAMHLKDDVIIGIHAERCRGKGRDAARAQQSNAIGLYTPDNRAFAAA
jgi:hypothetical protein